MDFWGISATQLGTLATIAGLFHKVVKDIRERREKEIKKASEAALWRAYITGELERLTNLVEQHLKNGK